MRDISAQHMLIIISDLGIHNYVTEPKITWEENIYDFFLN
jgi:hypothetical protein